MERQGHLAQNAVWYLIRRSMLTTLPPSFSALRSHVLSLYTSLKERIASLAILQGTPKSVFSILLSWTFVLPPDVEGSLVSCDLCRCEAGLSSFIQGRAQLQERSSCSKPQLTGQIRLRAGLRRAEVEHNQQLLLDRLCRLFPRPCAQKQAVSLLFVGLVSVAVHWDNGWLQHCVTTVPPPLLHKHPTSWHCPHDGIVFTYNINIY